MCLKKMSHRSKKKPRFSADFFLLTQKLGQNERQILYNILRAVKGLWCDVFLAAVW